MAALPGTSDIDLFGYGKGIVDFDTEITHRALDFFMLQQELHCAQVAGATINECSLGSAQRMCAEQAWVEPDAGDPLADQPSILPCRNSSVAAATAGKEVLTRLPVGGSHVVVDCLTGLLSHLEPDRLAGLLLTHGRAIGGMSVRRHIFHLETDDVAASQLAIDARLNIARLRVRPSICSLLRIDQTCLGRSGGFAPVSLPLLHGSRRGA